MAATWGRSFYRHGCWQVPFWNPPSHLLARRLSLTRQIVGISTGKTQAKQIGAHGHSPTHQHTSCIRTLTAPNSEKEATPGPLHPYSLPCQVQAHPLVGQQQTRDPIGAGFPEEKEETWFRAPWTLKPAVSGMSSTQQQANTRSGNPWPCNHPPRNTAPPTSGPALDLGPPRSQKSDTSWPNRTYWWSSASAQGKAWQPSRPGVSHAYQAAYTSQPASIEGTKQSPWGQH